MPTKQWAEEFKRDTQTVYREVRKVISGPQLAAKDMEQITAFLLENGRKFGWSEPHPEGLSYDLHLNYQDFCFLLIRDDILSNLQSLCSTDEIALIKDIFGERSYNLTDEEQKNTKDAAIKFLQRFGWLRLYIVTTLVIDTFSTLIGVQYNLIEQKDRSLDWSAINSYFGAAIRYLTQFSVFLVIKTAGREEVFLESCDDPKLYQKLIFHDLDLMISAAFGPLKLNRSRNRGR